jgi:hypothetical protein
MYLLQNISLEARVGIRIIGYNGFTFGVLMVHCTLNLQAKVHTTRLNAGHLGW